MTVGICTIECIGMNKFRVLNEAGNPLFRVGTEEKFEFFNALSMAANAGVIPYYCAVFESASKAKTAISDMRYLEETTKKFMENNPPVKF